MACRRMRGAAVLCAVAALAAGCPGVTAVVPAAPEPRVLNVARVAGVMQQLLRAPGSTLRRCFRGTRDGVAWHFLIAPPAGASRERRSREMRNTWARSMRTAWS